MPKATKAAARNTHKRQVEHGNPKRTKEPFIAADEKFFGELSRHIPDYRKLPEDDPLRIELTQKYGK